MSIFVSIATFKNHQGQIAYGSARHERSDHVTQARKSASRYWQGLARERGWSLISIYCCARGATGFEMHERPRGARAWTCYPAPEKPGPHVAACIERLGGEPAARTLPESLVINGWQYHRGHYVGDL